MFELEYFQDIFTSYTTLTSLIFQDKSVVMLPDLVDSFYSYFDQWRLYCRFHELPNWKDNNFAFCLMISATMTFSNIIDEMQFYNPTVSIRFIKWLKVHLSIQYIHWSYASDPHLYSKKPLAYWHVQKLALFILFIRLKHRYHSSIGRVIFIKTNRIATKMPAFE